jgi:hypothetical protein
MAAVSTTKVQQLLFSEIVPIFEDPKIGKLIQDYITDINEPKKTLTAKERLQKAKMNTFTFKAVDFQKLRPTNS